MNKEEKAVLSIEQIEEWRENPQQYIEVAAFKYVCDLALSALSRHTPAEWISVEEKLPEEWANVVGVNSAGAMMLVNHIWKNKIYPKLGYLGSYEEERYDGRMSNRLDGITHWMPIPPAPGAEKEEGK